MDTNKCPFCGADRDEYYSHANYTQWLCGSFRDHRLGPEQMIGCVERQRDQLQDRLREAECLLRDWMECANKESLHDLVSCQETEDFLNEK